MKKRSLIWISANRRILLPEEKALIDKAYASLNRRPPQPINAQLIATKINDRGVLAR